MSKRKSNRKTTNQKINRSQLTYAQLEAKHLLANLAPITDPFARDAVTVSSMMQQAVEQPYMPGEIVVAVSAPASEGPQAFDALNWQFMTGIVGAQSIKNLLTVERGESNIALVHINVGPNASVVNAMRRLDHFENVMWSSPNFYQTADPREYTPNDPMYGNQYHHVTMQNDLAWDITRGSPTIIIGITDDGVDITHEDLQENIWNNKGEIAGDGIDNDGNGYVDDVAGWNFVDGNNNPNPSGAFATHGTHVGGIAAGRTDNTKGIAGVSGLSTIMPLKFYNYGAWTSAMIAETFTYAADNGAQIVNTSYNIDSWVGNAVFTAALQNLYDQGVLHFNSAGNNSQLNPPRQAFQQSIIVASSDEGDRISSFSNYGTGIDISAPGGAILSSIVGGYDYFSGTSMATPNAAGAAALIWSAHPTWTRDQVAAALLYGADNIDSQNPDKIGLMGTGRVNTFKSITQTIAPPKVSFVGGLPGNGATTDDLTIQNFSFDFDQLMDPASVNDSANIELRKAGSDFLFDTADDIVYTLTMNQYMLGTDTMSATINGGPLDVGSYRLKFKSGGLQNPFGTALDGDGNSLAGDDFDYVFQIGLLGSVHTIQVSSNWQVVPLPAKFQNPVVIAGPASFLGSDPLTVRIQNARRGSFEIRLDEWDYRDGNHGFETVSYIVMEAGQYDLGNGLILEANNVIGNHRWKGIEFQTDFASSPVVLSQIVTARETDAASARLKNVTQDGFSVRIQEEQASDYVHANELISYIAISTGSGDYSGLHMESGVTPNEVTHNGYSLNFTSTFATTPAFFADMQTYNGGDPATVRAIRTNRTRARIFLEEERSYDAELRHNPEVVGYLAFQQGTFYRPGLAGSAAFVASESLDSLAIYSSLAGGLSNYVFGMGTQLSTVDMPRLVTSVDSTLLGDSIPSLSADEAIAVANSQAFTSTPADKYFARYNSAGSEDSNDVDADFSIDLEKMD